MCYRTVLRNAQFFTLLLTIDREIADQVRASRCPHCGGPLHAGHFSRKPRGIGVGTEELPEGFEVRFDFCCGHCRRRTLPASVRFLARRVYVGVAVAIATVVRRGPERRTMRVLQQELGVSRATVARWRQWWQSLGGSDFWQRVADAVPPGLDAMALPGSLLEVFAGDPCERMLRLLRLLRPLTGSVPVTLAGNP
jgi:hypothetical protein